MYVNARAIIERSGRNGTEILFQVRDRPGDPQRLELPGGTLEEFEPILAGLAREVQEETGLRVTEILHEAGRTVAQTGMAEVECLVPFFVYQTLRGPIDSVGFFFRCRAEGKLAQRGDGTFGHRWVHVDDAEKEYGAAPETFSWLTQAALQFYFQWRARGVRTA